MLALLIFLYPRWFAAIRKKRYFQIILFWIKWKIASFFNKKEEHKLLEKYFKKQ